MTYFDATTAYWTMYIPSIKFVIGSTLMDLDQLDSIQKPLMHVILPEMGYSSKTCRHVVYSVQETISESERETLSPKEESNKR